MGLMLGFLCLYVAFVPMLLPRVWWLQAIGGAINASVGYFIGFVISNLITFFVLLLAKPQNRYFSFMKGMPWGRINRWLVIIGLVILIGFAVHHYRVTHLIATQMDAMLPTPVTVFASVVLSLLGWWVLVVVARLVVDGISALIDAGMLKRPKLMQWSAKALLVTALICTLVLISRDYLWHKVVEKVAYHAMSLNQSTPNNLTAPTSPYKSGFKPDAKTTGDTTQAPPAQTWEELGHYGQRFVSLGVSQADIASVANQIPNQANNQTIKEPIRVFVGLNHQEPNPALLDDVVDMALAEMDRTGAFNRRYIVVQGATGRGWIEEYSSQAVEYLTYGDVASVAIQYSYLPSQFSFMLDDDAAIYANHRLIKAVETRLAALPKHSRPKLLLAGESLGAYASQSPFTTQESLLSRVDGAVWVGTPRFSPLWQHLVAQRDKPSTEALPVIDGGKHIRFMDDPQSLQIGDALDWQSPRIVFVQYATDPIVWWSKTLIWQKPDWMGEPQGRGVAHMPTWLPLLTFWELSLDMPASGNTPAGFGHIYEDDIVYAWANVLGNTQIEPQQIAEKIEKHLQITEFDK